MPQKNVLPVHKLTTAGSLAADLNSDPVNIAYLDNVAFQLNFTGTPTGTFTIQESIDKSTWTAMTLSSTLSASGSAATLFVELNQVAAPWVRVHYAFSSGTGSLDVWVSGKEV